MSYKPTEIFFVIWLTVGYCNPVLGQDLEERLVVKSPISESELTVRPANAKYQIGQFQNDLSDANRDTYDFHDAVLGSMVLGTDWSNHGGNSQKNGLSLNTGPQGADLIWENDDVFAIIAFQPYIMDDKVFAVRMRNFLSAGALDEIVAYDLETGQELWCLLLPYAGDSSQQWTAHILGVNNGVLYASRSGNGNSIEAKVTAYDARDGSFIWESEDTTDTGLYGGAVFADNGDLIVGSFDHLRRISAIDGSRVWSVDRSCPTSGACPAALSSDGVFINVVRPNFTTAVAKYDLDTGVYLYEGPHLPGFITQNAPFVSPDGGTVYQAKQHSIDNNFLYAFEDTGTELVEKWNVDVSYSAYHLHGIGNDGSIYTFLPGEEFVRLNSDTGMVTGSAGNLLPRSAGPQTAVGADGTVYISNGWASNPASDGRLWVFTSDLSTELFSLNLDRQNSGGPAIGQAGTLVMSDRSCVRAYRSKTKVLLGDVNQDGVVDLLDVAPFVALLEAGEFQTEADMNQDGVFDLLDVALFVDALTG